MKLKKLLYTTLFIVLTGIITLYIAGPRIVIEPNFIVSHKPTKTIADCNLNAKAVALQVDKTVNIKGLFIQPDSGSYKSVVILLHGIRGCKEQLIPRAIELKNRGIASFVFDIRGHGETTSKFCTFGYYEKHDISKIIDYLQKYEQAKTPIGIWGSSLGGAISLQAMAIEKRIDFGVIEYTFSDFRTIVHDYTERLIKIYSELLTNFLVSQSEELANFKASDIVPKDACTKITQPIFMSHGTKDIHIKPEYGKENFNNLASTKKEFHLIEGATHQNFKAVAGKKYYNDLFRFILKHSK